ncbi:MAG: hypothetical protein ACLS43_00390 [Evtepia gabavorous]
MTANEFYGPELAQMRLAERQVLEAVEELQRVWKAQGRQSPVLYTSSRSNPRRACAASWPSGDSHRPGRRR